MDTFSGRLQQLRLQLQKGKGELINNTHQNNCNNGHSYLFRVVLQLDGDGVETMVETDIHFLVEKLAST